MNSRLAFHGVRVANEKPPAGDQRAVPLYSGGPERKGQGSFLIAVVVDDHLAIRFPVAFLDDCFVAGLVLLDYGCSVAVSVSVIRANRYSGSGWANSDTDADIFGACGRCAAYACRCDYCQYVLHGTAPSAVENLAYVLTTG
jgi:hypothetical protein